MGVKTRRDRATFGLANGENKSIPNEFLKSHAKEVKLPNRECFPNPTGVMGPVLQGSSSSYLQVVHRGLYHV